MIKRIKIDQLIPGMFVHDLNCGWLENQFLSYSLKVKDEKTLNQIVANGIQEVYIDTEKGIDVSDAPTEDEVNQEIQEELNKVIKQDKGSHDVVPVEVAFRKRLSRPSRLDGFPRHNVQRIDPAAAFGVTGNRNYHFLSKFL